MSQSLAEHLRSFGHKPGVIINDEPAFIYLKVAKAAGTSILRHTLEKQPDYLSPYHLKDHRKKTTEWFESLSDSILKEYYVFTVVRNPWERFVSLASYVDVDVDDLARNFHKYMENKNIQHHAHSQSICSHFSNGEQFANRICRVENLQNDMNQVFDDLGLPRWEIPIKNTTEHKSYRETMSVEVQKIVTEIYQRDIDLLGYEY